MIALLAAVAETYSIDTTPGATTTFVSRGSNRWPPGSSVTATTIAGHRDMSQSICPGDAAYELVQYVFPAEVSATRAVPPATSSIPSSAPSTGPAAAPSAASTRSTDPAANSTPHSDHGPGIWSSPLTTVTGGVLAAGAGGLVARALIERRRAAQLVVSPGTAPVRPDPDMPERIIRPDDEPAP